MRHTVEAAADVLVAVDFTELAFAVDALFCAPAFAPVAAMRASRSAAVVQVMLVPAEFTRGRAAQLKQRAAKRQLKAPEGRNLSCTHMRPPPHCWRTNLPLTH